TAKAQAMACPRAALARSSVHGLSSLPGQRQSRHGPRYLQTNERDRVVGIGLALDLYPAGRCHQTGLVVQAEDDLAVVGNHVGQDDALAIGTEPARLPLEHEGARPDGEDL